MKESAQSYVCLAQPAFRESTQTMTKSLRTWVQIPVLPFTSSLTPGKLLNLSQPQASSSQTYLKRVTKRIKQGISSGL